MVGALAGLRVLEVGGVGPAPFACMMLADHGAEVIRIEPPGPLADGAFRDPARDVLLRSRKLLRVDLKREEGLEVVRDLADRANGLVEGFRPGVMERLGLGPDVLLARNPELVYGRMTGWGQSGPNAPQAGHDINYIALAGALHPIGGADKPVPPLNLVGDFGGGGMLLAFGLVSGMLAVQRGGKGQVIDCAMTDGASLLMSMVWTFRALGRWRDERHANFLDGAAPFYDTYETADGRWISIAAIEPQFYAALREKLGLSDDPDFDPQFDEARWPLLKQRLAAIFRTRARDEWCALLDGTDACFAPVLALSEVADHPHNRARQAFVRAGGVLQPAPAPRFEATPAVEPKMTAETSCEILGELGYDQKHIAALTGDGIVT